MAAIPRWRLFLDGGYSSMAAIPTTVTSLTLETNLIACQLPLLSGGWQVGGLPGTPAEAQCNKREDEASGKEGDRRVRGQLGSGAV